MGRVFGTLLLASLLAGCSAGKIPTVAVKPALQVAQGEQSRPLALVKVRLDLGRDRVVGYIGGGGFCTKYDDFTIDLSDIEDPELPRTFGAELRQVGYNVPQTGNSIFASGGNEAELWIGATIVKLQQSACVPNAYGGGGYSSGAYMNVKWEIADARTKNVIYTMQTEGSGRASGNKTSIEQAFFNAFEGAVRNLLAEQGFHDAVLLNRHKASASGPNNGAKIAGLSIATQPLWRGRISENIKNIEKNTVLIVSSSGGHGSGFYIDAHGHILTNHHVIEEAPRLFARLSNGEEFEVRVIASDPQRDIALLATEPPLGVRGLPLRSDPPAVGSDVYAIGAPNYESFSNTLTRGIVSAQRDFEGQSFIQSDVQVTHGNSGGPLMDASGNVIGLTVLGITGNQGQDIKLNLFVPITSGLSVLGINQLPPSQ